ncbi:MAG: DegT/DnrJ/EryC1/StrS aminotransferase family protein [Patescibacteria group bacterium]
MKNAFINEDETKKALADFILGAKKLSMGEKCREFEVTFAKEQGRKEAILFNSGGSANLAMLQALKNLGRLKDGDSVGFSALTWATNVMPIIQLGMRPVPVDCNAATLNVMSDNLLERLSTSNLKALFITNALGFAGDLDKIKKICKERDIILIEDNCEALNAEITGGKTGNFGVGASFSFFVAHHMSTIEGGIVCTDDSEFAVMLRMVRANGWDRDLSAQQQNSLRERYAVDSEFESKYTFYDLGFNFRPTEITGFLGLSQLKFLDKNIEKRGNNFLRIEKIVRGNDDLIAIERSHIHKLSPFATPIICKTRALREKYMARFVDAGVEIRPMIAGNIQNQPFYKKYVKDIFDLPGTDFLQNNSFYCGNYPELTEDDLNTIINCLK